MRRLPLALASALLCAAVACGGDDKPDAAPSPSSSPSPSPSPTTVALTKEAYVAEVNKICKRAEAEADAIGDPKTAQEFADGTEKYIAALEKAQADLRPLEPPAADKAAIETNFLSITDRQIALLKRIMPQLQEAKAKNDAEAAQATLGKAFQEYEKFAGNSDEWLTQYGLTDCSG